MNFISSHARVLSIVLGVICLGFFVLLFALQKAPIEPVEPDPIEHITKAPVEPDPTEPVTYDMLYVPDYPGAQHVEVWTEPNQDEWCCQRVYKRVKFVTSDTPEQVFTFYKDKLRSRNPFDGWHVDDTPIAQKGDTLEIVGYAPPEMKHGAPMFEFIVRAEQRNGVVHVTVERKVWPGM